MADEAEKPLWHEIRRLHADLAHMRKSSEDLIVQQARVTTSMTSVAADIQRVERTLSDAVERLERALGESTAQLTVALTQRVTVDRYRPVELLLYGLVGLLMTGVISALLALVVARP